MVCRYRGQGTYRCVLTLVSQLVCILNVSLLIHIRLGVAALTQCVTGAKHKGCRSKKEALNRYYAALAQGEVEVIIVD